VGRRPIIGCAHHSLSREIRPTRMPPRERPPAGPQNWIYYSIMAGTARMLPLAPGLAGETEIGSYFVANYPPFSVWPLDAVSRDALPAVAAPGASGVPLGLYLHIPFCRKRCHFCYFRVYTDKNAQQVVDYNDLLVHEWNLYSGTPAVAGRPLDFVYFGGGTPSYLSTRQIDNLANRLTAITSWDDVEEITFECEPGTISESKLSAIRAIGVTRLSLGVENFDDRILELNGRA